MKRFFLLFLCCLLLSGCKTKIIECTKQNNEDVNLDINHTVTIEFKKNMVSKFTAITNIILGDNYLEHKHRLIENSVNEVINNKNINYSVSETDNGFRFEISSDVSVLSEEEKNNITIININQSYEETKIEYESNGYVCK